MHYTGKQHDKKVTQFLANWSRETGEPIPVRVKEGAGSGKKVGIYSVVSFIFISGTVYSFETISIILLCDYMACTFSLDIITLTISDELLKV